jgi:hypothetical protein
LSWNWVRLEVPLDLTIQKSLDPYLEVIIVPSTSVMILDHLALHVCGKKSHISFVVLTTKDEWLGKIRIFLKLSLSEKNDAFGLVGENSINGSLIPKDLNFRISVLEDKLLKLFLSHFSFEIGSSSCVLAINSDLLFVVGLKELRIEGMNEEDVLMESGGLFKDIILSIPLSEVSKGNFLLKKSSEILFGNFSSGWGSGLLDEFLHSLLSVITLIVIGFSVVEELDSWVTFDIVFLTSYAVLFSI